MSEKKIIAVIGATGAQGGGLVRAILHDSESEYTVRALTRDVNSDKAAELLNLGAELVTTDLNDPESLKHAFEGAHSVFCVTFFWDHFSPEKEITHAKNMAEAAKAAGVKHVIWSTLEDTRKWIPLDDNRMPTLMDKYKVPHFDAKGEADQYFIDSGIPLTIMRTSFYWDNFIYFGMGPQKDEKGNYLLNLPMSDKKLPGIAAADIGKCAYGIFKKGSDYFGKTVGIAGEHLTGVEMAQSLSRALNKNISYNAVPHEIYRTFDFPGAEDIANMFQFKVDFEKDFCDMRNLEFSRSVNPELQTFDQWLENHKGKFTVD